MRASYRYPAPAAAAIAVHEACQGQGLHRV